MQVITYVTRVQSLQTIMSPLCQLKKVLNGIHNVDLGYSAQEAINIDQHYNSMSPGLKRSRGIRKPTCNDMLHTFVLSWTVVFVRARLARHTLAKNA